MTTPIKGDASGIESAIAEALTESKFPVSDDPIAEDAAFDAEFEDDEDGLDDGEPSKAEAPQDSDPAEPLEAADVPDSYWGVDLAGIPVEKRAAIIEHLSQQDGTIRKLQAKLSEPDEPAADGAGDEAPTAITDAQILAFLGMDGEDFAIPDAVKQASLKMARNQLDLEAQVARLNTESAGNAYRAQWNAELDSLESTYGNLPGSREEVLRYALREEVPTPADLYFKLTAPVKREVESLAAKARREAGKREQSAGVKPRSSSAEPAPVQPGMSLRDAVKAAASEAQKETGMSWKSALKRKLIPTPDSSE